MPELKPFSFVVSIQARSREDAAAIRGEMFGGYEDARDDGDLPKESKTEIGELAETDIDAVLAKYRALHDGISDMIEGGRLKPSDIPDDYQWLLTRMADLAAADQGNVTQDFRDVDGLPQIVSEYDGDLANHEGSIKPL
jgi:hypothetical protein